MRHALSTPRGNRVAADGRACLFRVGVCRKLRLNQTLKRTGDGFTLDLTTARYKTSRFYVSPAVAIDMGGEEPEV